MCCVGDTTNAVPLKQWQSKQKIEEVFLKKRADVQNKVAKVKAPSPCWYIYVTEYDGSGQ